MRSLLITLSIVLGACQHPKANTMPLPSSRNETAAPGDPVPSDTINDIQDAIIGGKRGPLWRQVPGHIVGVLTALPAGEASSAFDFKANANGVKYEFQIPLHEGERLLEARAVLSHGHTNNASDFQLFRYDIPIGGVETGTLLGTQTFAAGSGTLPQSKTITGLTELAVWNAAAFQKWYAIVQVTAYTSPEYIWGVWVKTDVP